MKGIATALGLTADANEAACLAALSTMTAGKVDKAVHETTLATLAATTKQLETLQAEGRKAKVDAVLEGALKARKIVPAQRESYAALCATDEGLKQVEALIEATPAKLGDSGLDERAPEIGDAAELDANTIATEATKLVTAAAAAGTTLSIQAAVAQVVAKNKKAGA